MSQTYLARQRLHATCWKQKQASTERVCSPKFLLGLVVSSHADWFYALGFWDEFVTRRHLHGKILLGSKWEFVFSFLQFEWSNPLSYNQAMRFSAQPMKNMICRRTPMQSNVSVKRWSTGAPLLHPHTLPSFTLYGFTHWLDSLEVMGVLHLMAHHTVSLCCGPGSLSAESL